MFDVPVDAVYVWVALGLTSLAVFGISVSVPSAPPPDAAGVAETVDAVAARDHPSTAAYRPSAAAIRLRPRRVAVRSEGGTAHATFAYGPVTPVDADAPLGRILRGAPPDEAFDSPAAFRAALREARNRTTGWERLDGPVYVRRLSWEEVDATLVGA